MNITSSKAPRTARFRHVVFARGARRAVNFAPGVTQAWAALPLCAPSNVDRQKPNPRTDADALRLSESETAFLEWLFATAGMDQHCYRVETLSRRLPACLRLIRAHTLSEARQRLIRDPSLIGPALGTLTIGVTSFFRDAAVFQALAREVIPSLPRGNGHPRVWSAGSSSGEELYSVAMLLAEAGRLGQATLLGTDCSAPAIAQAREGCYEARALRDVPQAWREKYFVSSGARWQVCDELRRLTQWRSADLTQIVEPGPWDLIICRNVAIYFTPAVATRVYQSLAGALRPGGVLVVGKAEQPSAATQLRPLSSCIYRR